MQWAPRVARGAPGPGGKQVRPGGSDPGALQHSAQVRRLPQHAAFRDVRQRLQGEPKRGVHLHVPGLSPEGSEVSLVQGCGKAGWQSEALARICLQELLPVLNELLV